MKILIIGPQGSGKTTQAEILAKELSICQISSGDLIREAAKGDPGIRSLLEKGELIDDRITARLVGERVASSECQGGFVMDGYPRAVRQLNVFDPRFDLVLSLEVSDEEVIRRMLKRGRADDTLDVIKNRLAIYRDQTEPLLDYYQRRGVLLRINGERPIEEVAARIKGKLEGGSVGRQ